MNETLLYLASTMLALWGLAHLFATRGVVAAFGDISADNRQIITMEWVVEGVAFISIAAFVATVTAIGNDDVVSSAVYGVAAASLMVLATVSFFTGFKVAFLPFRMCPFVLGTAAALIVWGAWL